MSRAPRTVSRRPRPGAGRQKLRCAGHGEAKPPIPEGFIAWPGKTSGRRACRSPMRRGGFPLRVCFAMQPLTLCVLFLPESGKKASCLVDAV